MPNDPGQYLSISITPLISNSTATQNVQTAPVVVTQAVAAPATVSQSPSSVLVAPQAVAAPTPVYVGPPVYPYGYPYSYGPSPFSVRLGFGYYGGYHRR